MLDCHLCARSLSQESRSLNVIIIITTAGSKKNPGRVGSHEQIQRYK
jgi:hypothetical protein